MLRISYILFFLVFGIELAGAAVPKEVVKLSPVIETDPVHKAGDAADDPAIWINASQPSKSIIFGANKRGAIHAYNLSGKEVARYSVGNINNIDIRYDLSHPQGKIDILGGSNRTNNTLVFFSINKDTGALSPLSVKENIKIDQAYGFCFYQNRDNMKLYAYSVPKTGNVQQFSVTAISEKQVSLQKVKDIKINSQPEACVADDIYKTTFIGEEAMGVWSVPSEPTNTTKPVAIATVSQGILKADVEGLALYHKEDGSGYLVVSSQGDNTFALYERKTPHKYLGSFTLVDKAGVDGVSNTDGLEVMNYNFGGAFSEGLVVVQDGSNASQGGTLNQNFKFIDWASIRSALKL